MNFPLSKSDNPARKATRQIDQAPRKARNRKTAIVVASGICCLVLSSFAAIAWDDGNQIAEPLQRIFVDDSRIDESSGLARSLVSPNRFWTHNDSGDAARIFAIDIATGNETAKGTAKTLELKQQKATDWEDITSGRLGERNWIIVGDVGDNSRKRTSVHLLAFEEPQQTSDAWTITPEAIWNFEVTYPDGAADCEAIAIDSQNQRLLMIKKTILPTAGVYAVDLSELAEANKTPIAGNSQPNHLKITAKHIVTLPIPMITAMDIRGDGKALALTTYRDLFVYERTDKQSWEQAFQNLPRQMVLPKLRQIEAVAFDQQGDLWITSERSPMALFKVDLENLSSNDEENDRR